MSKKQEKAKPVYQSCNVKFPERAWEPSENGWSSRSVQAADLVSRRAVAETLNAVMLP